MKRNSFLAILAIVLVASAGVALAAWQSGGPRPVAFTCYSSIYDAGGDYVACCHHEMVILPNGDQTLVEGPLGCDSGIQENECPNDCP